MTNRIAWHIYNYKARESQLTWHQYRFLAGILNWWGLTYSQTVSDVGRPVILLYSFKTLCQLMETKYVPVPNFEMELNNISVVDGPGQSHPKRQGSKNGVREKTTEERKNERLNSELLSAVEKGDACKVKSLLLEKASPNATCRDNMITATHIAALNGYTSIFELLIKSGADLTLRDIHGRQAVHMASWGGHLNILKSILRKYNNINSQIQICSQVEMDCLDSWNHDHNRLSNLMILDELTPGSTALHLACKKALSDIVNFLLDFGADVNIEDSQGLTPLDVTGLNQIRPIGFRMALSVEPQENGETPRTDSIHSIVNNLIKNDAKVPKNQKSGHKSVTTLHTAVEKEDIKLIECLLHNGGCLSSWNIDGDTPVHLAVKNRSSEILQIMVDWSRVDVNVRDKNGKTPLLVAAERDWSYGVEILLEANANVSLSDNKGQTVYHLSAELGNKNMLEEFLSINRSTSVLERRDCKHRTPLFVAIDNDQLSCVELLNENGADLTAKMPGNISTIHTAAYKNSSDIIKYIINDEIGWLLKDTLSEENKRGLAPLHIASENGYASCVEALLDGGCDPCIKSTKQPEKGVTPLHQAAKNGHLNVIMLITQKSPVCLSISTNEGWYPLHFAAASSHSECVRYMIRNGADISEQIQHGSYSGINGLDMILYCMPQPVEFLEEIFDSYLEVNNHPLTSPECEIQVKYDILDPYKKQHKQLTVLNAVLNSGNDSLIERILIHPLVEIFVYLKWRKLRFFFIFIIILYLLLTTSLTIMAQITYVSKATDTLSIFCAELARCIMFISLIPIVMIEILNASQRQRYYVSDYESWVKWAVICLTMNNVVCSTTIGIVDPSQTWVRYSTSIAVLLSWLELLFLLSHFPIWGYYVLMFSRVAKNLLKVMFSFVFMYVGFTFAFLILFEGNAPYKNILESALKVIVMMLELEYDDTFQSQTELTAFSIIGRFMFVTFLILVSIVMMNLMVGLAVSDINKLEEQGRALKMAKQTAFLSLIENILPIQMHGWLNSHKGSVPEMTVIRPAKSMNFDYLLPKSLRDAVLLKVRDAQKKKEEKEDNATLNNLGNKIDFLTGMVSPHRLSSASTITK